jgi:hypothetical protein
MTNDEKPKIGNPAIFFVVLTFFLISAGLIVYGLVSKKDVKVDEPKPQEIIIKETENEGSLDDYFKGEINSDMSNINDIYLKDDPFKDACASTAGDDKPAYKSNTVCLR